MTRANYNVNHHEYLCPICQRLSNTVLPMSPPTASLWIDQPSSKMTFAQWVNELESIATKNIGVKPTKRIIEISQQMMNFFIDNQKPIPSVPDMTRGTPNKDLAEMTTNFTYNCFMVSFPSAFLHSSNFHKWSFSFTESHK